MDINREINAFYNELEINPLSPSAIALWYALLHIQSRVGLKDRFSVPVGTLSLKTGLSERSVSNARNELKTKRYIDFQSRSGNKSAMYHLKPLSANISRNTSDSSSGNVSGSVADNASALNNLSSSSSSTDGNYESFYAAHERVFNFPCNPFQSEQLAAYIDQDGMEEAVVIRAIERAAEKSVGYNFKFITRILDDYFKSGVRTLDQAVAIDDEFDRRKYTKGRPQGRKIVSFADMAKEAANGDVRGDRRTF